MNQEEEIIAICVNCRFHDPKGSVLCYCRRHAPKYSDLNPHTGASDWPIVRNNDWCGEFEPYHHRPPKPPWK